MSEQEEAAKELAGEMLAERQWPVRLELKDPIDFGKGKRIESLEFRRGTLGDLDGLGIAMPSVAQLLVIASRMCGEPVAALKRLSDADGAEVLEIALAFFVRCLPGGRTLLQS